MGSHGSILPCAGLEECTGASPGQEGSSRDEVQEHSSARCYTESSAALKHNAYCLGTWSKCTVSICLLISFWLPRLFSFLHARNKLSSWFEMQKLQFCITKTLIQKNNYDYILKTQITNPMADPLLFWRSVKQVWLKRVLLIAAVTWSTSFLVITAVSVGTQVMRAERHFSCSSLDSSPIICIFIHWKYFISCQLFLVCRVLFQFIHFSCSQ